MRCEVQQPLLKLEDLYKNFPNVSTKELIPAIHVHFFQGAVVQCIRDITYPTAIQCSACLYYTTTLVRLKNEFCQSIVFVKLVLKGAYL